MASDTDRRRLPGSLHRKRPTEEEHTPRLIPIPDALRAVAETRAAAQRILTFNMLQFVMEHLRTGDIGRLKYEKETQNELRFSVEIQGKWYHVHLETSNNGGNYA